MKIQNFNMSSYVSSLPVLCLVILLSACSLDDESIVASVKIDWTPPSEREDGSALSLSEIGGYRIYYGTTEGDYPNQFDISGGTVSHVTASTGAATLTVSPGVYHFVVTTYDTDGRESQYSLPNQLDLSF